jgi:hypothetical protein
MTPVIPTLHDQSFFIDGVLIGGADQLAQYFSSH